MSDPANTGARRFVALLFAIPIAFSVLFFVTNAIAEHEDTDLIRLETLSNGIERLRSIANDAEVGEHGYLLTSDVRYRATIDSATTRLASDTKLDMNDVPPELRENLVQLVKLVRERVAMANRVLAVQHDSGWGAALSAAENNGSEPVMERMRSTVARLQDNLKKARESHFEHYRRLARISFLLFLFGTLVMLIAMVWLYNRFVDHMQARDAANAELQNLNADLERRISERTQELQEFNEELQQFAYVASHDLQEPLRTITSFSQLLAARYRGKLDDDANEFMDYIVNSAHRMTDLINGLLTLVRLRKAGHQVTPVSLNDLVDQAQVSLQAAIRESGACIQADPLPVLKLDAVQFTQVLQNLIANAIKYRKDEPPVIRIKAQRESTNWIVSVEDNGRGFDPQFAERIFGLFQRLHSREVQGTGMGLTIVRRIVERHGGRIWAESTEGKGSIFHVSLPASLESRGSELSSPQAEEAAIGQ